VKTPTELARERGEEPPKRPDFFSEARKRRMERRKREQEQKLQNEEQNQQGQQNQQGRPGPQPPQ
jgi:cell division protease FtsH